MNAMFGGRLGWMLAVVEPTIVLVSDRDLGNCNVKQTVYCFPKEHVPLVWQQRHWLIVFNPHAPSWTLRIHTNLSRLKSKRVINKNCQKPTKGCHYIIEFSEVINFETLPASQKNIGATFVAPMP